MEAMDGPVNFGENMINWGLLVKGFMPQGFGMPYNKPIIFSSLNPMVSKSILNNIPTTLTVKTHFRIVSGRSRSG